MWFFNLFMDILKQDARGIKATKPCEEEIKVTMNKFTKAFFD